MTASARFLTASAKAVYFLSAVCYNAVNPGKQLKGADIMKKYLRIMLAAALAAISLSGCNNSPAPTGEVPVTSGNAAVSTTTARTTEAPEMTAEELFQPMTEGDPLPGTDCVQSNIGTNVFNQIMEIDEGYYYNSIMYDQLSLHYHDKATGKTIYLCAKPECTHDGNDFCPATTKRYEAMSTVLYDDKIYISAVDKVEKEKENFVWKLIAADFDGTSLSEVAEIVRAKNDMSFTQVVGEKNGMVIHRGKALVPYEMWDASTAGTAKHIATYGFAVVDIATGNIEYREETENMFSDFKADGNAFYYRAFSNENNVQTAGKTNSSYYDIYRYDIKERKSRRIDIFGGLNSLCDMLGSYTIASSFAVADGKIYYSFVDNSGKTNGFAVYDMTTGETSELSGLRNSVIEWKNSDGDVMRGPLQGYGNDMTYDGKYLYISKYEGFASTHTSHDPQCYVIDTNGKYYGKIEYKFDGYYGLYAMNFLNGNVYIQTDEKVVYCAVEDLLGGNEDWQEAYTFEDVENKSRY